ncbi:MAG: glutathione synthetase [Candidatus Cyclobacteriaceae bacterium M2_1C_046]
MNIAFVINEIATLKYVDTTISMGLAAANRGHKVFFTEIGDAIFRPNGHIATKAVVMEGKYKGLEDFVHKVKDENAKVEKINCQDLDVIYLRNNPSEDMDRPWAKFSGILFGQFAVRQGVLVVNDPDTLAYAHVDKMYFEHFPESIRPSSLITRQIDEIEHFFKEHKHKMILKPLEGSGGKDVFLIDQKSKNNLKQIVEAIARNGYVIAQEYLPEATKGDVRVFMMNGKVMTCKDKFAAFRRVNKKDFRSNMSAGGQAERFKMTDKMLEICDVLRPKLIEDGIFCAGLDIVGDKLIELNITSPGGLSAVDRLEKVSFNDVMIEAIEKKLYYKKHYGTDLANKRLAVME